MNRLLFIRFLFILAITMICCFTGTAFSSPVDHFQSDSSLRMHDTVIIGHITIHGNNITKAAIILRELKFKKGDTALMPELPALLEKGRQNIFNTRLFNFVTIDTCFVPGLHQVDIAISVIERWYIWPVPYIEISDRNFNVWWETREFNRLTYGVDFTFFNARGRNETLRILTHFGFNQKFGFTYKIPYVNRRQTIGTGFGTDVQLNHEVPVATVNNEPIYFRSNSNYLKKLVFGFSELNLRPDFYTTHTIRLSYAWIKFDSSVLAVPGYSISADEIQQFVSFTYLFRADHRDVQFYPLNGFYADAELNHTIPYSTAHNSYLKTNLKIYLQLSSRWYWATGLTGKLSFEKVQPYFLQRGLGWGRDYVRGYEYYVVEGQHFFVVKNNLKFALVPQRVEQIGFIKTLKFNTIPFALYLNAFADLGYAYHYSDNATTSTQGPWNTLENTILAGYGLGLDFTTYYDFVVRIEGAMNLQNQPGLYIHFIAPI